MCGLMAIIGMAGIAGAIEQGKSLVPPVIITIIGVALVIRQIWKEEREEENNKNDRRNTNCSNYPAGLERMRRRA